MGVKYQLSINAQIERATGELFDLLADVKVKQDQIWRLKQQRDGCDHEWSIPAHKFPKESWCVKCGLEKFIGSFPPIKG